MQQLSGVGLAEVYSLATQCSSGLGVAGSLRTQTYTTQLAGNLCCEFAVL